MNETKMRLQANNSRTRSRPVLSYTQRVSRGEGGESEITLFQADREKATFTCCHGRKLNWKQARVIVERTVPHYHEIPESVCLYDILLGKEEK
jgi:hypothetical protein